ncbi:MAG: ATP-binding domain-containing protein [Victivallales bacterium]|nr:ATP-binding domain-containing protein [Victivallales bacterium]
MLDVPLARSLFRAVRPGTHVVLVGDKDQLPSVGPGAVLHDLIECGRIPVTELRQIYRQQEGSRIITSAHEVNCGIVPQLANPPKGTHGDFYFYPCEDPAKTAEFLGSLVSHSVPKFFGLNPLEDIQENTPMRRGECGTIALNHQLQEALNPPAPDKPELTLKGETPRIFRLGDRVMQTKNNYEKQVFNGEMGRIVQVNLAQKTFQVLFDQAKVEYQAADCAQLIHAYAITIHKSQGSEFPCVILPLLSQHYVMLQRNLLYTGMTRAKKLFILLGNDYSVKTAVRNNTPMRRHSLLAWRLAR